MIRSAVVAIVLGCACAALAQEKDPVQERLAAAKSAYEGLREHHYKSVDEWFDKRETEARKAGDKKLVDQIKAERKAFDETGELPKSAPGLLSQGPAQMKKALEAAYATAYQAYTKANRGDEAALVAEEWHEFHTKPVSHKPPAIDLLALIDTKTHALVGEWKKDATVLSVANKEKNASLMLPYEPGAEYDLEVRCRRDGIDGFGLVLVAGGRHVFAAFDGWPPHYACGLDTVDRKRAYENVTTVKGELLTPNRDHTTVCSVRGGKIELSVNGKVISSFKGDFDRLSLDNLFPDSNKNALYLFVPSGTTFRFDRIVVMPVKGKGKILK